MREESQGFAIWISGLPASGKSLLSAALVRRLAERDVRAAVLESDVLRKAFATSSESQYSPQDRAYFYRSMAFIGRILTEHGVPVIFDATANKRAFRDQARQEIPRFIEVYVDTPLEVCMQRDPKGIYRKARDGQATDVPGLQSEYEPPLKPEVVFHGEREDAEVGAKRILEALEIRGMI